MTSQPPFLFPSRQPGMVAAVHEAVILNGIDIHRTPVRERLHGIFPFTYQMQTRFSDLDKVGHVNNVAVAAILQEGRNRFIYHLELTKLGPVNLVVGSLNIEFAGDLFHPAPIDVSVGLLEIGRSSFRFGQIARQNGQIAVYAEVVQVARDEKGSIPLNEAWRPLFERAMIVPR